ncbi:MAG: hypothetical protein IT352_08870 [Gemmatimonadales bacterium]|nr:hypothetical protein [Gemmatimonadales bacterium]
MRRTLVTGMLALGLASTLTAQERLTTDWGTFMFERDMGTTSGLVAGTPDSVFKAVQALLVEYGLKLKDDPVARQLGVNRQRVTRRIGKQPVSDFLSCGEGLTGPNADTWHVSYTMGVEILPGAANKSRLVMSFTAEAIDVPNGRNDRVPCATTGRLELQLVKRLRSAFPGTA